MYGNFDIILDDLSRSFKLYSIPHVPYAVIYLVPMLIVCRLVLAIRCYDQFTFF